MGLHGTRYETSQGRLIHCVFKLSLDLDCFGCHSLVGGLVFPKDECVGDTLIHEGRIISPSLFAYIVT